MKSLIKKYPFLHCRLKYLYLEWRKLKSKLNLRLMALRLHAYKELIFETSKKTSGCRNLSGSAVVVCAADETFAFAASAMLTSMVVNLKKYKVKLYFLYSEFSEQSKKKIEYGLACGDIDIVWVKINPSGIKDLKITDHITRETYYKLFLPQILPLEVKKLICLDCDLIFREDIGRLWDVEIDDSGVLAVPEMSFKGLYASSVYGIKLYEKFGIPPDCRLFNAGVLVINLEKWRKDNIGRYVIDYLRNYKEDVIWLEQDGLNALFAGKWGRLDPRWNLQTPLLYDYSSWKKSPLDKETYEKTIKSPYIVHFNTSKKPWLKGSIHPYQDLFFYYLNRTPWKGWRP